MNVRTGSATGRRFKASGVLICALFLAGCDDTTSSTPRAAVSAAATDNYVVMGDDLAELKADFNAAVDQVRLLFIVGPT
jgi:hypothetical protein